MLDGGGTRSYGWNELGVGVRQRGETLPQAPRNPGSPRPRAVVALKAQTLETGRPRSVTDQSGREAGRIYQTTNGQRIESIF